MPNILGLGGLNTSGGTNKIIAGLQNDLIDVDAGTGFGINLTSTNDCNFDSFLDSLFFQNFNHTPITYDGSAWTTQHVGHTPISKYLKQFGERMYLFHIKINSTTYASRVWYSDLPTIDTNNTQTVTWGFQSGTNGAMVAGEKIFRSANAGFKGNNIKVGDPLIVEGGDNAGQYTVARISDDQRIDTIEEFQNTATSATYWVGSNWFDVRTNNSDVGTWAGENNDRLLLFKNDSLHRFDGSTLRTVKGVPGTTSGRSVINLRGATIYFHGSAKDKTGFYLYDGVTSKKISNKVQPFIDGMAASIYNGVIGWHEGDIYRAYIGDLSNSNSSNEAYNISMSKAVFSYDVTSNNVSVDPISDAIKCAGRFRESNAEKWFVGNDSNEVFHTPSGNSFDGDNIPFTVETVPIYPRGTEVMNVFTRIKIIARDAGSVSVSYKLWDDPFEVDQQWQGLGELRRDTTELKVPVSHSRAAGIQLKFSEIGTKENVPTIEKVSIYSYPQMIRTPEIKDQ
jgi:hypothetical protein